MTGRYAGETPPHCTVCTLLYCWRLLSLRKMKGSAAIKSGRPSEMLSLLLIIKDTSRPIPSHPIPLDELLPSSFRQRKEKGILFMPFRPALPCHGSEFGWGRLSLSGLGSSLCINAIEEGAGGGMAVFISTHQRHQRRLRIPTTRYSPTSYLH